MICRKNRDLRNSEAKEKYLPLKLEKKHCPRKQLIHTGATRVLCMVGRAIEMSSIYGGKKRRALGAEQIWAFSKRSVDD